MNYNVFIQGIQNEASLYYKFSLSSLALNTSLAILLMKYEFWSYFMFIDLNNKKMLEFCMSLFFILFL